MISLSHVISQKTTVVGPYALFQVVLLFYLMMFAARLMLFTLYLQVLWWSWASHPLSPQALSCSCWLGPKSLRWETLLRTEPSSMELRNVGLLLAAFAILGTCHVPFETEGFYFFIYLLWRWQTQRTVQVLVTSANCKSLFLSFCSVWNDHHHWTGHCICYDWHVWRPFRDGCWDMLAHHHPG